MVDRMSSKVVSRFGWAQALLIRSLLLLLSSTSTAAAYLAGRNRPLAFDRTARVPPAKEHRKNVISSVRGRTPGTATMTSSRTFLKKTGGVDDNNDEGASAKRSLSGGELNQSDDFYSLLPPEEESVPYNSNIDWDAEWKKVMKSGSAGGSSSSSSSNRPGQGYYKNPAEIAAIRAANKVTREAQQLTNRISNSTPSFSWRALQGDWKFWIGILVILSFGTALLTASAPTPTLSSSPDQTFFI